jgi:hypothetical protein
MEIFESDLQAGIVSSVAKLSFSFVTIAPTEKIAKFSTLQIDNCNVG